MCWLVCKQPKSVMMRYKAMMHYITIESKWTMSRDSSETFIDSRLLWNTIGVLMDVNNRLWMTCPIRG